MPVASGQSSDRWRQIEDLFHEASRRDPENRAAFLERACGTDSDLRREVESLLAILDQSEPFLESAVQGAAESYLERQGAPLIEEGSQLDHYRVIRLLGAGGMGEVYLAEDTSLKRKVALKVLPRHLTRDPLAMRRLEQEAQIVSALNHANLLTVFEFCHFEGRHFLVTEFIEGHTVREMVARGPLEQSKAVDIAAQAAAALSAAHASGVIHRDIKPENIIVRADGCVKVLDFGIAKLAEPLRMAAAANATTVGRATFGNAVLGTPRYMSPEQARGIRLDKRTDLFSLGAVFYEMLSGQAAFKGDTQNDLIADILRSEPAPIARVPKALDAIVSRSLKKDLDLRYQNAESLLSDLRQFQRETEFQKRPKSSVLWAILPALLIGLVVAGFFLFRERPTVQKTAPIAPRASQSCRSAI